ncbi:hypothetical protein [Brevundimonas sp.]|uniref:hypothetical protein n=1 Tax=Brevundimonas sp. TaxID=1871086 RepID=UPI003D1286B3
MSVRTRPPLTLALALLLAAPASAQDTGLDWDTLADPGQDLTAATLAFDSGVSIGVRCSAGRYDALLAGLPPAAEGAESRALFVQFRDEPVSEQRWTVTTNPQVAVSDLPARFARSLRDGGRMQIRVIGGGPGGANLRYIFDLPASAAAIDRTLEACEKPLTDPRDAEIDALDSEGLPGGVTWAEQPRPTYPSGPTYTCGFAVVSCLTLPDGRLRDCMVESQHPLDGGFGDAALRATRRGRVQMVASPDEPMPTRFIVYRTQFRMAEPPNPPTGTRIPRH